MLPAFGKAVLAHVACLALIGFAPLAKSATWTHPGQTTMSFVSPLDGQTFDAGADIAVGVNASDPDGVRSVRLFVNGRKLSKDRSAPYQWPGHGRSDKVLRDIAPGVYTVQAVARNRFREKTAISATFTVEAQETALSFVPPLDGQSFEAGSDISIGVDAENPNGVRAVRLVVNGKKLSRDRQAPYQWPGRRRSDQVLRDIAAGTYSVQAVAVDRFRQRTTVTATFTVEEPTQGEVPDLAWADSYSVGEQCYCMSDFDQGIADTLVNTPYGEMTVPQICADIGPGPGSSGQPLYNDVQCGNGPGNSEANELSCPGRVDMGQAGCSEIGPTWKYPDPVVATANPAVNDGPLRNPLKGFHIGFDATCCLDFPQEVYFGNFMASVGYQNFTWAQLEPEDDQWNWDVVEQELANRAGSKQKHVVVQLNAEWTRGDRDGRTPQWFLDDPRFEENVDEARGYKSHRYDSEFYQEEVKEFIAEFINRFKDDPRIFVIQMGMVGYFGEFNVFPNDEAWLPEDIKFDFFKHYRDHVFGRVARDANGDLVVLESGEDGSLSDSYNGFGALTQVRYPDELGYNIPTDGIGYTNGWVNLDAIPGDGNNDDDIGNKDFNDPLDALVADDGRALWALGPVGGEWPPNREPSIEGVLDEWLLFWDSEAGGDYVARGHYSVIRPPQVDTISRLLGRDNWALVPEDWNFFAADAQEVGDNYSNPGGDVFRSVHRQMGYNYQISNVEHFFVADNSRIVVNFDVDNVGLAPFYYDWSVELAILDSQGQVVQLIPVEEADMRTWASGDVSIVSTTAQLGFDLGQAPPDYRIGLRMSQPGATDAKSEVWKLDARFTYIVVSNDVEVVEGAWDGENKLVGGWNLLSPVSGPSNAPQ